MKVNLAIGGLGLLEGDAQPVDQVVMDGLNTQKCSAQIVQALANFTSEQGRFCADQLDDQVDLLAS